MSLTDAELRSTILGYLGSGDLTEAQLLSKLQPSTEAKLPIHDQTAFHARMLSALSTLKFQHRAWKLESGLWTITDRGKTSHG